VYRGRLIMTMPGSRNAVQLAMTKLIAPELGHLVYEVTK
jgi:molybdopterin biosynthesis enzyme MoaB